MILVGSIEAQHFCWYFEFLSIIIVNIFLSIVCKLSVSGAINLRPLYIQMYVDTPSNLWIRLCQPRPLKTGV
jgi:hypothetical protein